MAASAAGAAIRSLVRRSFALSAMPWETSDPFLFCVHHNDQYPAGKADMSPVSSLAGRNLGSDFSGKDGWSMYHGRKVPGFPSHPHRGLETLTIVRTGLIDHFDSMGATTRYGSGDFQWMSSGSGIQHSEMFPLVETDKSNPLELFQIWLNMERAKKMTEASFLIQWRENIESRVATDAAGRKTNVTVYFGQYGDAVGNTAPPHSYAQRDDADLAVMTFKLEPSAEFLLPACRDGTTRTLYLFSGAGARIGTDSFPTKTGVQVDPLADVPIVNSSPDEPCELLLLQGRPIGEPVAQYGPFVMNTHAEIQQAYADFQRTQFGGWPWPKSDCTHPREQTRFAEFADKRREEPPGPSS